MTSTAFFADEGGTEFDILNVHPYGAGFPGEVDGLKWQMAVLSGS